MFTRYASAVTTGTFMTFGLLYVMQLLIGMQPGAVSEPRPGMIANWIGKLKPLPPPPPPEPIIDPADLTNVVLPPVRGSYSGPGTPVYVPLGEPEPPPLPTFAVPKFADGPLVVLLRISPTYPLVARSRGLEGYVIVQFDVSTDGYATNITVVESSDHMFEKAAIEAARRFKFKPRVVDGIPQVSGGIQNLFRFVMND